MSSKVVGKDVRDNYYPRLTCDLKKMRGNMEWVMGQCRELGIEICGVIKGCSAMPPVAKVFQEAGCKWLASSRMNQFRDLKEAGCDMSFMLIRIPMLSELPEVVELCDVSLQSDLTVLKAIDEEAGKQGKIHQVILMKDIGDLREGFWDMEEMIEAAKFVESAENLYLLGTGTNIGCYGALAGTVGNMEKVVETQELVEEAIGRKLDYISGADTHAFPLVMEKTMPAKINSMRLGEVMLLNRGIQDYLGMEIPGCARDVWHLEAEVIEVRTKASMPVGEKSVDAFGNVPEFEDRGMRKRALIAVGRADYMDTSYLFPTMEGVEVLGASSDHTILDIEDCKEEIKVGDILSFEIPYQGLLFLGDDSNVAVQFLNE